MTLRNLKRPKKKVGRKLKPANLTDTSFRAQSVVLPSQAALIEDKERNGSRLENATTGSSHFQTCFHSAPYLQ